ncbi:beta-lactamase/transpeptidase-like protein [Stipitochalara longipes BDJ]|nr:beta-lactamase/transpeptidase-like protein [Stipitochalara longipes BDJ]
MKALNLIYVFVLLATVIVADVFPDPSLLLGPVFPAPRYLSTNFGFLATGSQLSSALKSCLSRGESLFGNFTPNVSSVSISMASTAQEASIFAFNLTGSGLNMSAGGVESISIDTVFRIGSISKLFTAYTFLLHNGLKLWQRPITDYVPELRRLSRLSDTPSDLDSVRWEEVTLGSLASHMSGIGRDYGSADLSLFPFQWTEHGLPQLTPSDIPTCGGSEMHQKPCTREEYFEGFVHHHPVFRPHSTPIYSNTAFRILGYAIEAIVGENFDNITEKSILKPLQLNHSSVKKPADNLGAIPQGDSMWSYDLGDEGPGGGMYSSSSDLAMFGRDILLSTQLPPSVTRRWMKPVAHISGLTLSVGAPWEIWRTRSNIAGGHIVELYTKGGSIGLYESLLVLIPDYQVAVAILVTGSESSAVSAISEMVFQEIIPVLHDTAREEAERNMAGQYIADANINSSMLLTTDEFGLVVEKWVNNGSDLLDLVETYSHITAGGHVRSVRLFPTDLVENIGGRTRVGYRILFDIETKMGPSTRIFNQDSKAWGQVDQATYGKTGVDDVVVEFEAEGSAVSIELRVLGVRLVKS